MSRRRFFLFFFWNTQIFPTGFDVFDEWSWYFKRWFLNGFFWFRQFINLSLSHHRHLQQIKPFFFSLLHILSHRYFAKNAFTKHQNIACKLYTNADGILYILLMRVWIRRKFVQSGAEEWRMKPQTDSVDIFFYYLRNKNKKRLTIKGIWCVHNTFLVASVWMVNVCVGKNDEHRMGAYIRIVLLKPFVLCRRMKSKKKKKNHQQHQQRSFGLLFNVLILDSINAWAIAKDGNRIKTTTIGQHCSLSVCVFPFIHLIHNRKWKIIIFRRRPGAWARWASWHFPGENAREEDEAKSVFS